MRRREKKGWIVSMLVREISRLLPSGRMYPIPLQPRRPVGTHGKPFYHRPRRQVKESDDMITGCMLTWEFNEVLRMMVALRALLHSPPPPRPAAGSDVETMNQWLIALAAHSDRTRFVREFELCDATGMPMSLRHYVSLLLERMKNAVRVSLFADLDDLLGDDDGGGGDDEEPEDKNDEQQWLMVEARACFVVCFAGDSLWQECVMVPRERAFSGLVTPDARRAARFHKTCMELATDVSEGRAALHDIGTAAPMRWMFG